MAAHGIGSLPTERIGFILFFIFLIDIYLFIFIFSLPTYRAVKIDDHMATTSSCPQCVSKYIIDQLPSPTDLCETLNGLSLMALLLISLC